MSGSSVSKDRFVRVLTNGIVVSDELVQERFTKVSKGLAAVQAEIARLNRAGVVPSAGFLTQVQTLKQQLATAMQQPGNQAKCDALKPLKSAFRTIAQQSAQRVDVILADVDLMRQQAVAAQSAINNAQVGISRLPTRRSAPRSWRSSRPCGTTVPTPLQPCPRRRSGQRLRG